MKVLESQSAVLTNYEVLRHLAEQKARYKKTKRRGPPSMETVVRELLQYLRMHPSPLSQKPMPYNDNAIVQLLDRLNNYELTKGEMIMLLNLRPASIAALNTIIEEMGSRFSDEQQEEILTIVAEILGQFPPPAEAPEDEQAADVQMEEAS